MKTFNEFSLPPLLLQSLEKNNFTAPTDVQTQTIPLGLEGKDVLGSAQTGTGKTLAFCLPMLAHLLQHPKSIALILAPTRELATQVFDALRQLLNFKSTIRMALLIGGGRYFKQFAQLRANPRIIIGTPGRILDHFSRDTIDAQAIDFLVIDEMDRMLAIGFDKQLEDIVTQIPEDRQTLMFSATISKRIEKLAAQYLRTPERVSVNTQLMLADNLKEETIHLHENEKDGKLLAKLNENNQSTVIVFVKTKASAERVAEYLRQENHNARAIHGDLPQQKRERVLESFRQGRLKVLVATDVASRGLDIKDITLVVNYDLPPDPEDYVHRVGRTARAGASGSALNFVSGPDRKRMESIKRYLNPEAYKREQPFEANQRGRFNKNRSFKPYSSRTSTELKNNTRGQGRSYESSKERYPLQNKERFRSSEAMPQRTKPIASFEFMKKTRSSTASSHSRQGVANGNAVSTSARFERNRVSKENSRQYYKPTTQKTLSPLKKLPSVAE